MKNEKSKKLISQKMNTRKTCTKWKRKKKQKEEEDKQIRTK